jgi:predicted SAM-dependent methyltransferase
MEGRLLKLDIGSGQRHGDDGWIGVDSFSDADCKASMWELPYPEGTIDEIFSSHALEHVPKKMVLPTLQEWFRVLKPGGKLTLRVPDLEWCCTHWLTHQTTGWDMDVLFGNQNHEGEFHKTGFNYVIIVNYLSQCGYQLDKFERLNTHNQMTMSFEAHKRAPSSSEAH